VLIIASSLVRSSNYSCRFSRDKYGNTESDYLDSVATLSPTSDTEISCVTPAWGSQYAAANTHVLLVRTIEGVEDVHEKVQEAHLNYSFYTVWDNFTVVSGYYGARGGDVLNISGYGIDPLAAYKVRFDGSSHGQYGNCTGGENPRSVLCIATHWGKYYKAATASVSLYTHDDLEVLRIRDLRNATARFDFFEVEAGVLAYPDADAGGGGASGGEVLSVEVYGLNVNSSYLCRFVSSTNTNESLDSAWSYPTSPNAFSCVTPGWGFVYPATTTNVYLFNNNTVVRDASDAGVGMEFVFEQVVVLENASIPTLDNGTYGGTASGEQTITLDGLGFDETEEYRAKVYDSSGNTLYSETTYPVSSTVLSLELPAWGLTYPATTTTVRVQYRIVTTNTTTRRLTTTWDDVAGVDIQFIFQAAVTNITVGANYGARGGSNLTVTAPGLTASLSHMCVFTVGDIIMNATTAVVESVSSLRCVTPPWGVEHCAATANVAIYEGGSALAIAQDIDASYDFFEEIDYVTHYPNDVDGGVATGDEPLIVHGFGLCDNDSRFTQLYCRFSAVDDSQVYFDMPADIMNNTFVNCSTPAWGYMYPYENTYISLASSLDGVLKDVGAAVIDFDFDCCIQRQVTFNSVSPDNTLGIGSVDTNVSISVWDLPFNLYTAYNYTFESGDAVNASVLLRNFSAQECTDVSYTVLSEADSIGMLEFKTPPGVGANLSLDVRFESLPLLNFVSIGESLSYHAPHVYNVTNKTGITDGGFNLIIDGIDFGGKDFDPEIYIGEAEKTCNKTIWVSDAQVICQSAPSGTGDQQEIYVEVGGQRGTTNALFSYNSPRISEAGHWDDNGDLYHPTTGGEVVTIIGTNFGSNIELVSARIYNQVSNESCPIITEDSDPGANTLYCTLPVGTGSGTIVVIVNGIESEGYPFAYELPSISALTPSSSANVKGNEQLVVRGSNFGTDSKLITVKLKDESSYWEGECTDPSILVVHSIVICDYPAYDSDGTGQDIDVQVVVNNQSFTLTNSFSYFDDTGFFSVILELQVGFRTTIERATKYDIGRWKNKRTLQKHDGRKYMVNQDYMRKLMTDNEQTKYMDSLSQSWDQEVSVFAKGILWFIDFSSPIPYNFDLNAKNLTQKFVNVNMTIKSVYTVDGETNAGLAVGYLQDLFDQSNNQSIKFIHLDRNLNVTSVELLNISSYGGDKTEFGEVFCDAGKQPQSDGSAKQGCSYCPVGTFKPRIGMWYDSDVSSMSENPCTSESSPLECLDRLCYPCPLGGNCNTTGVVIPGRQQGYWRDIIADDKEDFTRYGFYSCLLDLQCFGTRPYTSDDTYELGGPPTNGNCSFGRWYDDTNRQWEYVKNYNINNTNGWILKGTENGKPLCSICSDGYYEFSNTCVQCPPKSDGSVTRSVTIVGVCMVIIFFVAIFVYLGWIQIRVPQFAMRFVRYFQNLQQEQAARDLSKRNEDTFAFQKGREQLVDSSKVKIALSFLQISAVYNVVYDVTWPGSFVKLMAYFNVLMDVNLMSLPALEVPGFTLNLALDCEYDNLSFFDTFTFSVVLPVVCIFVFFVLGLLGWLYHKGKAGFRGRSLFSLARVSRVARDKHEKDAELHLTRCWELFFFMLLVIYPSVSRVSLQMLNCFNIDQHSYLTADFNIDCSTPRYKRYKLAGWICVAGYVVGIPLCMLGFLHFGREHPVWEQRVHILYASYTPRFWWFEIYDLMRKLFLTGLIIFIRPDTSTQIAVGTAFCMLSVAVHAGCYPFTTRSDNRLQYLALMCILWTMFIGLLLRVDVGASDEDFNMTTLSYILIISNVALVSILVPLAIPKFGQLLHTRLKRSWRGFKLWQKLLMKKLMGKDSFKLYIRPIGSFEGKTTSSDRAGMHKLTINSRFISIEDLTQKIDEQTLEDVPLRMQALIFDGVKLDAPLRPITDYNIRVFREPKLPKENKTDVRKAKKKLKNQRRWYHRFIGAPEKKEETLLEKKKKKAALVEAARKKKAKAIEAGGEVEKGNKDDPPPPEKFAYYKGRCWGVETVMFLQIDPIVGSIRGEGFNKTVGEFTIQGQHYASKLEEETAEKGNAGLMYMFAAEADDTATIARDRYDLIFELLIDTPPPDRRIPENEWPTRQVAVLLGYERNIPKSAAALRSVEEDDSDEEEDPVLTGHCHPLDESDDLQPTAFEPLNRPEFLAYSRRLRRHAATIFVANSDDFLDMEMVRLRECQELSIHAFNRILDSGDTAAAVRYADQKMALVNLRAEVARHQLLGIRSELDFEDPSLEDVNGAAWSLGGVHLKVLKLVVNNESERRAVQAALGTILDSDRDQKKRRLQLLEHLEDERLAIEEAEMKLASTWMSWLLTRRKAPENIDLKGKNGSRKQKQQGIPSEMSIDVEKAVDKPSYDSSPESFPSRLTRSVSAVMEYAASSKSKRGTADLDDYPEDMMGTKLSGGLEMNELNRTSSSLTNNSVSSSRESRASSIAPRLFSAKKDNKKKDISSDGFEFSPNSKPSAFELDNPFALKESVTHSIRDSTDPYFDEDDEDELVADQHYPGESDHRVWDLGRGLMLSVVIGSLDEPLKLDVDAILKLSEERGNKRSWNSWGVKYDDMEYYGKKKRTESVKVKEKLLGTLYPLEWKVEDEDEVNVDESFNVRSFNSSGSQSGSMSSFFGRTKPNVSSSAAAASSSSSSSNSSSTALDGGKPPLTFFDNIKNIFSWTAHVFDFQENEKFKGQTLLMAPLSEALHCWSQDEHGWKKLTKNKDGRERTFWVNKETKEVASERPVRGPLPAGWSKHSDKHGRAYYVEDESQRTTSLDPRRHTVDHSPQGHVVRVLQAHSVLHTEALERVLKKRDLRRLAIPLFDDPALCGHDDSVPTLEAVVESVVTSAWKVIYETSLPPHARGSMDADDIEAVNLREKLSLIRLQMENMRRQLSKIQSKKQRRRSTVIPTSSDGVLKEQLDLQYWKKDDYDYDEVKEARAPGVRYAYVPAVPLEAVDEDALDAEFKRMLAAAEQDKAREVALAKRELEAEEARKARMAATGGSSVGGILKSGISTETLGSQLQDRVTTWQDDQERAKAKPRQFRAGAALPRTLAPNAPKTNSFRSKETLVAAVELARRVARSPMGVLGVMAQDVANLRAFLGYRQPIYKEANPEEVKIDFNEIRTWRNMWVAALCEKDLERIVGYYSLRTTVLGRWFSGQDLNIGGNGITDRNGVRTLFEVLFGFIDSIEIDLFSPPSCSLHLKDHIAWRSDIVIRIMKNGKVEVLEGYLVLIHQLTKSNGPGKVKAQYLDVKLVEADDPRTSRWDAIFNELSSGGDEVVAALESDLEENWPAFVAHTSDIALSVDIPDPHQKSMENKFDLDPMPRAAFGETLAPDQIDLDAVDIDSRGEAQEEVPLDTDL